MLRTGPSPHCLSLYGLACLARFLLPKSLCTLHTNLQKFHSYRYLCRGSPGYCYDVFQLSNSSRPHFFLIPLPLFPSMQWITGRGSGSRWTQGWVSRTSRSASFRNQKVLIILQQVPGLQEAARNLACIPVFMCPPVSMSCPFSCSFDLVLSWDKLVIWE